MFAGEKHLLKKNQINAICVARWDEISVKKLWAELKNDQEFTKYFSDNYPADKGPNRQYFFNILHSVYPDYLKSILDHANRQRTTTDGDE